MALITWSCPYASRTRTLEPGPSRQPYRAPPAGPPADAGRGPRSPRPWSRRHRRLVAVPVVAGPLEGFLKRVEAAALRRARRVHRAQLAGESPAGEVAAGPEVPDLAAVLVSCSLDERALLLLPSARGVDRRGDHDAASQSTRS